MAAACHAAGGCVVAGQIRSRSRTVEGPSLIHARMRAALDGIDADATFTQGHELDTERAAGVPREHIGRMLSREQAAGLLDRIERSGRARPGKQETNFGGRPWSCEERRPASAIRWPFPGE
jgi:hypothetical protein